jgi:hypothetical protein
LPCLGFKIFLQEKAVQTTKQKEERRKKLKPEEQKCMPQEGRTLDSITLLSLLLTWFNVFSPALYSASRDRKRRRENLEDQGGANPAQRGIYRGTKDTNLDMMVINAMLLVKS